ncbi:MAG: acetyl-CoA decarbonylase/synthase complex subunit delta, partial [Candidatus Omnitrophota bacterium]
MAAELMLEKWSGQVSNVSIGATKEEGGTRAHSVKIGGQKTLPFLFAEADIPNKPVIAFEVWDTPPLDWPEQLIKEYGDCLKDPFLWAQKCVNDFKAKLLCVRLQTAHPDFGNKDARDAAKFISMLLKKITVPLIILGCGDDAKDNQILPAASEAAKGERCL